MPSILGFREMV